MTTDPSSRHGDAVEADCRRNQPRRRVLLAGKVVQAAGLSMDCTIRNLTEAGAQIRVPAGQALPDAFDLIEIRSGVAYRAKVAWRSPAGTGVQFSERLDLNHPSAAVPLYLRTLWLGCASRGVSASEGG
ncbi:MAG TPA: PilZ domain-containing protein [Caulobacteraceae bacterium]|jgi:hypothetical protein